MCVLFSVFIFFITHTTDVSNTLGKTGRVYEKLGVDEWTVWPFFIFGGAPVTKMNYQSIQNEYNVEEEMKDKKMEETKMTRVKKEIMKGMLEMGKHEETNDEECQEEPMSMKSVSKV